MKKIIKQKPKCEFCKKKDITSRIDIGDVIDDTTLSSIIVFKLCSDCKNLYIKYLSDKTRGIL